MSPYSHSGTMRVPPALPVVALLAGCLAPAGAPGVAYALSGSFTILVLPANVDEMVGVVVGEGGQMRLHGGVPLAFTATELTAQACRLVHEFALMRPYLEIESLGTCVAEDVTDAP